MFECVQLINVRQVDKKVRSHSVFGNSACVTLIVFAINIIYLITSCIGCRWQGFGNGGSCRGGCCEQKPGSAPCQTQAFQPSPKWTHCRTKLGLSEQFVVSLGECI